MARPDNGIATKDYLASELRRCATMAGSSNAKKYELLAKRAETGEFDDYADVHICGPTALYVELVNAGFDKFAKRVFQGEFDATFAESEAWARSQKSPKVIKIMEAVGISPNRKKDH